MRRTRRKRNTIRRPHKKVPKELYYHYSKGHRVEITYNSRIIAGQIIDINPINESIILEKENGTFEIIISDITRVEKV